MLYRDLTFASLTTLKHAVMVYRSRSTQTLYVSTPFLPGATTPTFTQALLSQMICAYQEALQRDAYGDSADGGNSDEDDQGDDSGPPRGRGGPGGGSGGGEPSRGVKPRRNEPEPGPSGKSRRDSPSDCDKVPAATLSTIKQLALAKVSRWTVWFLIPQVN